MISFLNHGLFRVKRTVKQEMLWGRDLMLLTGLHHYVTCKIAKMMAVKSPKSRLHQRDPLLFCNAVCARYQVHGPTRVMLHATCYRQLWAGLIRVTARISERVKDEDEV